MEVYKRIKDIREDKEKLQKEIAELLQTTQQQYSKYENGLQEIPARHLKKLAVYYNTSIDYLTGLTNERKPYPKIKQ